MEGRVTNEQLLAVAQLRLEEFYRPLGIHYLKDYRIEDGLIMVDVFNNEEWYTIECPVSEVKLPKEAN